MPERITSGYSLWMGRRDVHKIDAMLGLVGQDEFDIDVFFREGFTELVTRYSQPTTVMGW